MPMPPPLCATCGTSYPPAAKLPATCAICEDERQHVPPAGQSWITSDRLAAGHANAWRLLERDLYEIQTTPRFAIGQRAMLIRTPSGNILWDCVALIDDATTALINALGGLAAIAISHPHYYTTMQDWAAAFDVPVHLHANDRRWVMRHDDRLSFWEGDRLSLPGATQAIRLGGHFAGGTVLHWPAADDDKGALLTGDIVQVGADRRSVSFLWSYPNNLPLSAATVARIAGSVSDLRFERIYGAFGSHIVTSGSDVLRRSAERYQQLLAEEQP